MVAIALPFLGLVMICVSQLFQLNWCKIEWDRLLAEVGALLLVVSVLHWLFELGLREEMLREVAGKVSGGVALHDAGLEDCSIDSKQVEDTLHWARCANLTVGRQYSTRFLKDFHELLRGRCVHGLPTTLLSVDPAGAAAGYLTTSGIGADAIRTSVAEALGLVGEYDAGAEKHIKFLLHDTVLRYAFIQTDEYIWVTFFRNSSGRATVPALKIRAGTALYEFFDRDIRQLSESSHAAK